MGRCFAGDSSLTGAEGEGLDESVVRRNLVAVISFLFFIFFFSFRFLSKVQCG